VKSVSLAHLLAAPGLRVEMKKAAMMRIDLESFGAAPHGTLRWMPGAHRFPFHEGRSVRENERRSQMAR
jgi:hypothetical protein